MARMIPPNIYSGCPSPGEREVFHRLREDPGTRDWIVLHSLDVAEHLRRVAGEIDFVIIIPKMGVLCIEVKAHRRIRREDGLWYYGANPNPEARSPFKQASEAMHSIRGRLQQRRPELKNVVFWSTVLFPYVEFSTESPEWHSWQVIDSRAFVGRPISRLLCTVLAKARDLLCTRSSASWFRPELQEPDAHQCDAIAQALRPDFEFFEPPRTLVTRLNEEAKRYTQEQLVALDAMEANPRVVFVGPAGTGKTILAIEAARRSADGRKVLLVCYNRLLGKWLEGQIASLCPQVIARTLHRHMLSVSQQAVGVDEAKSYIYWENDLPAAAIDRLLADDTGEYTFDELVVDEAPDIFRSNYLDFLDLSLRGGLASGRWRIFGDFEKQAIYGSADLSLDEVLKARIGATPVYSLRVNCRNTPRIAEMVHLLGGLTPRYGRILRPDDGIEPELHHYTDNVEQPALLVKVLEKLHQDGFIGHEIAILSPRRDMECAAAAIRHSSWKNRLRPFAQAAQRQIGYGSIRAFKGMEASAVVITDINHIAGQEAMSLFYIAITRALHRLVILVNNTVREEMLQVLLGNPNE